MYKWWGISTVPHGDGVSHFLQHAGLLEEKKFVEVWRTCWFGVVWSIWLMRNKLIFENKLTDLNQVCDLIKIRTWFWCSVNCKGVSGFCYQWFLDPRSCVI